MNLFALLMHSFFDRQAREQSERFREAGLRAAEKGRQIAIASALFAVMGAFLFAAAVVFAIEMGLQFDRGLGVTYSGLMVSASILGVFALVSGFAGFLIASMDPSVRRPASPPPPPPRSHELRDTLEDLAIQLLKQFVQSQRAGGSTPPPNERETRS